MWDPAMPSPPSDQEHAPPNEDSGQDFTTGHEVAVSTEGFDPTMFGSNRGHSADNVHTSHHRSFEPSSRGSSESYDDTANRAPRYGSTFPFATPSPGQNSRRPPVLTTSQAAKPKTGRAFPKKVYLNGFPNYPYVMPSGPALNFTMPDILVILPNWFSNQQIIDRFINNGLTPIIHVAIMQEHRTMDDMSVVDIERLREGCSDDYRRVMRTMDPGWKRVNHRAPLNWNNQNIAVNHFLPDVARNPGYTAPPPIPFKHMMIGIKKLPQGPDAGDLTRALEFALHNQKTDEKGAMVDFMFPDDIHAILNHIGRTILTNDHLDVPTRIRYDRKVKDAAAGVRKREREHESPAIQPRPPKRQQREYSQTPEYPLVPSNMGNVMNSPYSQHGRSQTPQAPPPHAYVSPMYGYPPPHMQYVPLTSPFSRLPSPTSISMDSRHESPADRGVQGQEAPFAPGFHHHQLPGTSAPSDVPAIIVTPPQAISAPIAEANDNTIDLTNDELPQVPDATRMPPDVEASIAAIRQYNQSQGAADKLFEISDIDALLAGHHDYNPQGNDMAGGTHSPSELLRECAEADDPFDFSIIASAARWCRDPDNSASEYTVGDLDFVVGMQNIAGYLET
jgi:hypothetical protein